MNTNPPGRTFRRVWIRVVASVAVLASTLTFALVEPDSPAVAAPPLPTSSTDETFAAGSYIIDLGASLAKPNGLRPYGLVYELIVNRQIPVTWAIANNKAGGPTWPAPASAPIDFTTDVQVNRTGPAVSKSYRSGAFIIPAAYTSAADAALALPLFATTVVVDRATTSFTAPVFDTITYWPKAVLDAQNGSLAVPYFTNAGIPNNPQAYSFKAPSQLNSCDDIYVMPHADPTWAVHQQPAELQQPGRLHLGRLPRPERARSGGQPG
jgi:large repetitive protein